MLTIEPNTGGLNSLRLLFFYLREALFYNLPSYQLGMCLKKASKIRSIKWRKQLTLETASQRHFREAKKLVRSWARDGCEEPGSEEEMMIPASLEL